MLNSIANSLGIGAGLDTGQIVLDLAAASREPKIRHLDTLVEANQARISAVGQVRSSLENFAESLGSVAGEGGFSGKPTVSDETFLSATVTGSGILGEVTSEIEISQLARSQTLFSSSVADEAAAIGQGGLTLSVGGTDYALTIDATNDSLTGLADAINASGSTVTANIVNDGSSARLVLKGATGEDAAFTLTSDLGADPGLANFTFDGTSGGLSLGQAAQNSLFTIDGIDYSRAENEASDILPGLSLNFKKITGNESVSIGRDASSDTIRQNVDDFIAAFNTLRGQVSDALTATRGDFSMRRLDQQLSVLAGQSVTSDLAINSLTDIGVSTNRDGTLSLDSAKLGEVLESNPDAVIALFNPPRDSTRTETTDPGITLILQNIEDGATSEDGLLTALDSRLDKEASALTDDRERVEDREAAYQARLQRQFGNLDARLASFQATQSYLEQQIRVWQGGDS